MQPFPDTGFAALYTHIVGDTALAIATRPGEDAARTRARTAAAIDMTMAYLPRDAIEATLAGHCVMFHEMMTDALRDLRAEGEQPKSAAKRELLALNKAFLDTLKQLRVYQARPAEGTRELPPDAAGLPAKTSEAQGGETRAGTPGAGKAGAGKGEAAPRPDPRSASGVASPRPPSLPPVPPAVLPSGLAEVWATGDRATGDGFAAEEPSALLAVPGSADLSSAGPSPSMLDAATALMNAMLAVSPATRESSSPDHAAQA